MLKMVDGTGIIGVDMVCPLGVSTPQPPNYDRVELEGTGMLVLPNSLDAPLERLELGGKTEQVQTTGKNLFDPNNNYEDLVWIRNDGEIVAGSNARTSDYIPVEQGNYAFQFDVINNNQMFVAGYNTGKQFVKIVGTISKGKCIIKIDDIQIETIRLSYTRESTRIQLERSETQTPYEPYTGGKPSPSQEYQQEIKNVGKWNEEKRKYEVDVKVTGKNLLDKRLLEGGEVVEFNGVECYKYIDNPYNFKYKGKFENGQQYAFTLRILRSASKESNITDMVIVYTDGSMKQMRFSHGELKTFVSYNGKTIDYFSGAHNFSVDCYLDLSVTRLSVGGQDAGYDPYKEQTLTLTSDRPITKWDRLVEQGGEIGWLYGGKIIDSYNSEKIDAEYMSSTGSLTVGATVLYKLKTTEFVPLPQSEQNAIRALKTYYPTTVITADGGELDPDIKVTYRKEI